MTYPGDQLEHEADVISRTIPMFEENSEQDINDGQSMPHKLQGYFEDAYNCDFSHTRIFTGQEAISSSESLNARAFVIGNDISFNRGEYAPHNEPGFRLLAHELVHVNQQKQHGPFVARQIELPKVKPAKQDLPKIESEWIGDEPTGKYTKINDLNYQLWNFDIGSAEIKPRHKEKLDEMAKQWAALVLKFYHPDELRSKFRPINFIPIIVTGFASETGSKSSNQVHAMNRANAVREYLEKATTEELVTQQSFGVTRSIYSIDYNEDIWSAFIIARSGGEVPRGPIERTKSGESLAEDRCVTIKFVAHVGGREEQVSEPEEKPSESGLIPGFLYKTGVQLLLERIQSGKVKLNRGPILTASEADEVCRGVYASTKGAIPLAKAVAHFTVFMMGGIGSPYADLMGNLVFKMGGSKTAQFLFGITRGIVEDVLKESAKITIEELAKEDPSLAQPGLPLTERILQRISDKMINNPGFYVDKVVGGVVDKAFGGVAGALTEVGKFENDALKELIEGLMKKGYAAWKKEMLEYG